MLLFPTERITANTLYKDNFSWTVLRHANQIATVQFVLPESDISVSEVPFIGCKSSLPFAPTIAKPKLQQRSFTQQFVIQPITWLQTVKSEIMGLATIDPHSHKVPTKLYKIPKFGVNRPNGKQHTAIWKCQNLQRNVWLSG